MFGEENAGQQSVLHSKQMTMFKTDFRVARQTLEEFVHRFLRPPRRLEDQPSHLSLDVRMFRPLEAGSLVLQAPPNAS